MQADKWQENDVETLCGVLQKAYDYLTQTPYAEVDGLDIRGAWLPSPKDPKSHWQPWLTWQAGAVRVQVPISQDGIHPELGFAMWVYLDEGGWELLGTWPHDLNTRQDGPWWAYLREQINRLDQKIVVEIPVEKEAPVEKEPVIPDRLPYLRDHFAG